jgi:hypothetical protein
MNLSPEQRERLHRVLADELQAARTSAVAAGADDAEFTAEIERRLRVVAEPQPGDSAESV